tara:strand:- start:264 stop:527 length:264 start_codon:yes stop_codon:yes gene_type:complete
MSNKEKQIKTLALLEKRVLKLDNQLRLIGNLSNKQYYSLSENKINALEFYLKNQVDLTINRIRKNQLANFDLDIENVNFEIVLKGVE